MTADGFVFDRPDSGNASPITTPPPPPVQISKRKSDQACDLIMMLKDPLDFHILNGEEADVSRITFKQQ